MKDIPLVLVHGYPFDHTMWFSTIAALGSAARVLAPDLPGFGRSAALASEKPSMRAMAEGLAAAMDQAGTGPAMVAGMSMGGYVALAFAERYPERVAGLGLISSQAVADTAEARQSRQAMIERIRTEGPAAAVEAISPKMFTPGQAQRPELLQYLTSGAAAAGPDGLCWALQAMAERADRTGFLRQFPVPVLIAHGSEDQIVPAARARQLAENCRDPIFVEIRGAGHATPLEAPDQVAAALERLVRRVRGLRVETPEPAPAV